MAIFQLSDSKPATAITGFESEQTIAAFAHVLTEQNVPFSIVTDEYSEPLLPYSRHIVESFEQLHTPVEVVVDFTWGPSLYEITEDILAVNPGITILSSAIMTTATYKRMVFDDANIINFNGLPGFFPHTKVVELAPALGVSPDAMAFAQRYLHGLGFATEVVEDRVGLVTPRVLSMLVNEAAFCVMENVASPADIDTAMKLGTNYPKGPLEWADEIGIDVITDLMEGLKLEYAQERYRTCALLKQYTRSGRTGKKAGKGFYAYDTKGNRVEN
jgi:3-hydroxybutyryl-CoA dehydrogenase